MSKRDDGGPAFPHTYIHPEGAWNPGMTLRDYFAAVALQGILASDFLRIESQKGPRGPAAEIAHSAYAFADVMLEERAK